MTGSEAEDLSDPGSRCGFLSRGLTTADLKLAGTTLVMSDELTIFNIVGPSAGHSSLNSFAGKRSKIQVVGFKDETILDNISRKIFSKVFRTETN